MTALPGRRRAKPDTVIVCLGHPLLGDDGIGLRLAGEIRTMVESRARRGGAAAVEELDSGGLALLDTLAGYRRAIIVDAIECEGARPGCWRRLGPGDLAGARHVDSVHDTSLATALALGRHLGVPLPPDEHIHVIGIEIESEPALSDHLSPELEAAYPRLSRDVVAQVELILA